MSERFTPAELGAEMALLERRNAEKHRIEKLGHIMLEQFGEQDCQDGYATTDPYYVGRCALGYGDINPDGTLN